MFIARVLLLATALSAVHYAGQAQPAPPPAAPAASQHLVFEVVDIRPSKTEQYHGIDLTPDGANATGISLKNLIRSAYNETHDQLWEGEPSWTADAFYDITAKFDPSQLKDVTDTQRRAMVQAALADRFKLALHAQTRVLPHYELVVAKGGPKMQETRPDGIKLDPDNRLYCRAGLSVFRQCTMAEFARVVSSFGLNAIVEDKTGLTARYDFTLSWSQAGGSASPPPDAPPSIYDAVRSQLGLELRPIKSPLEIRIVDHVERPAEN